MAHRTSPQYSAAFLWPRGFNLTELLLAVAAMGIAMTVLALAFTSIRPAKNLAKAANRMVATLERVRTIQNIIVGWYRAES